MLDEEGKLLRKADMFTKRTIRQRTTVRHVETAEEALGVSIGEKARVDLPYMQELTGMTTEQLVQELRGVIFPNPERLDEKGQPVFETADAYLSGNVRDKLLIARRAAEVDAERYGENVKALEAVQPKDLDASEIDVRLGATWLPPEVIRELYSNWWTRHTCSGSLSTSCIPNIQLPGMSEGKAMTAATTLKPT